jgi:sec-independent protein translocase protein TatA
MIVIGVIAVLLFGSKLPKLAFSLGSSFTQFKKGIKEPLDELRGQVTDETKEFHNTVGAETRACETEARRV